MSGDEPTPAVRRLGYFESVRSPIHDHLATEVIAAYVDGELRMSAYLRASGHLAVCAECAAEVDAQQQARVALRRARPVCAPSTLFASLARIPGEFDDTPSEVTVGATLRRWGYRWRRRDD